MWEAYKFDSLEWEYIFAFSDFNLDRISFRVINAGSEGLDQTRIFVDTPLTLSFGSFYDTYVLFINKCLSLTKLHFVLATHTDGTTTTLSSGTTSTPGTTHSSGTATGNDKFLN